MAKSIVAMIETICLAQTNIKKLNVGSSISNQRAVNITRTAPKTSNDIPASQNAFMNLTDKVQSELRMASEQ